MLQGATSIIMNGARFLDLLSRLGYPDASSLNPSDFDGMFDTTSENKEFINLLCSLGPQNVLSEEELRSYHALEKSGKTLLTEQVLDEMEHLKNSAGAGDDDEEDDDDNGDDEDARSIAELEQELEDLRRQQRASQKRLQQLQCLRLSRDEHASALGHHHRTQSRAQRESLGLGEGGEAGDSVKAVARENVATNGALQELREEVERLQGLTLMSEDKGEVVQQQQEQMSVEQQAKLPAASLLSQLPLEPYLQETRITHQSVMDHYKTRSALLEDGPGVEEEEDTEEEEEEDDNDDKSVVQRAKREMEKLQAANMLIQGQLLQARAEEAGANATKDWLCQQKQLLVELPTPVPDPEGVPAPEKERVWSALLRRTQQLCSAVLWGQTREQGELTQEHARLQELLLGELLQQKAHLDLLHCGLQSERQGHGRAVTHTGKVARGLREEAARVEERAKELQRLQENAPQPDPILSVTDPTVQRLLQMLESGEGSGAEGWFAGVTDVATVASDSQAELQRASAAEREERANQQRLVRELEKDGRRLKRWAEPGESTAAAVAASHLCPSAQELRRHVQELEQQSGCLYAALQQVAAELSSKRSQLQRSGTLRAERELYTLFHSEPNALRQALESQERRQ